jgi:hypothetical protein
MAQVVDLLPDKCKALSSNPDTVKKKKKRRRKEKKDLSGSVFPFSFFRSHA